MINENTDPRNPTPIETSGDSLSHHSVTPTAPTATQTPPAPVVPMAPAITPLKPPMPSIYNGSRDKRTIDDFLWSLECYFRFFPNLMDEHKLAYAAAFVRGPAQTWIRHTTFISYVDFVQKLEAEFSPVDYRMNLFDRWETISQTTSVERYSREFFELKMTLKLQFPEEYLIQKYIKGLKPRVKLAVVGQNPRSLEDATQIAQRVDMLTFSKSAPSYGNMNNQPKHRRQTPHNPPSDPMDLDNIKLTKLTAEERQRLKKDGRCYRCRKPGHVAKDCKGVPKQAQANNIVIDSFQLQ